MRYKELKSVLESGDFTTLESFVLPARAASFGPVPEALKDSGVGHYLESTVAREKGLWRHQSAALDALCELRNVVVPTGTASGKSLIFRSIAFHRILRYPDARVIVFYPLKALASDQYRGWVQMAEGLGLQASVVGRIDGSVRVQERDSILQAARIVVMTPDVCHAWLMSRLSLPFVKAFVARLAIVVMDEAHTLDGVFGSNFAFLIRRLLAARDRIQNRAGISQAPQFVAATATIANPKAHLEALTGSEFTAISEALDGSPSYERMCAHVAAPVGHEMEVARALHAVLLRAPAGGGFITFVDSRRGVESLARTDQQEISDLLGSSDVLPYRAGYDARDREAIETRLRAGTLRGVVSTSALELGIDLPHLTAGLNVGVPSTRKAYRQRLGRVGRSAEGAFVMVAAADAFSAFGTTFREYHEMSVEDSYLYLDNRFMQFAHARCLVDELEAVGGGGALPTPSTWPEGFEEVFQWAKPGGSRPPTFDAIAQLGGDTPQRGYPLRNVGELNFKIAQGEGAEPFGEANESQALRECYPGATYVHIGRAWEVVSWQINASSPFIRVKPGSPARSTRPRIQVWINAGVTAADVIEGHFHKGDGGFIAECQMEVTERVVGYEEVNSGNYRPYSELRQLNPNMRARTRNFRTSGVVLCIADPWFKAGNVKGKFAVRLEALFNREYSILPQDVGSAATNIAVRSTEGGGPRADCIVIFDQTYGSLRLTERLFLNIEHLLGRLAYGANAEEGSDREFVNQVSRVCEIVAGFAAVAPAPGGDITQMIGSHIQVFTPGSRVSYRERGDIGSEVVIIEPALFGDQLMYKVEVPPRFSSARPGVRMLSAQYVEPTAVDGDWDRAWWNTDTQAYEDPPEMASE